MGRATMTLVAALAAVVGVARNPASTVHVTVGGGRCILSQKTVPVGPVTFVVSNHGSSSDDFVVDGSRTRLLRTGRTATLTVDFAKAGSYSYRCTVAKRGGRLTAAAAPPPAPQKLAFTQLASGLGPLTDVAVAPTDPNRVFAVEQDGQVVMLDGTTQDEVADFGSDIRDDGENGLLDMTFSPQFAQDRTVYFYYISDEGSGDDTLVSATMDADWAVDMKSVHTVLQVATPGANHRGGDIAFGPDGDVYVPIGDGDNGTYTVIGQYAQDPSSMLGAIVRVDPVTGDAQIWAKGLRNPWRDYIDTKTGLYYIADVGENDQEEIDVVPLTDEGLNFGWPCMEGTQVDPTTVQCPDPSQFTAPVLTYPHEGRCAVIGGVVVHDPRLTSLAGSFLYSDLCDGELRAFTYANGAATDEQDLGLHVDKPTSFGEGPDGRVYLVTNDGSLYRLDPA